VKFASEQPIVCDVHGFVSEAMDLYFHTGVTILIDYLEAVPAGNDVDNFDRSRRGQNSVANQIPAPTRIIA
jgi:hypothetical protein